MFKTSSQGIKQGSLNVNLAGKAKRNHSSLTCLLSLEAILVKWYSPGEFPLASSGVYRNETSGHTFFSLLWLRKRRNWQKRVQHCKSNRADSFQQIDSRPTYWVGEIIWSPMVSFYGKKIHREINGNGLC